MTVNTYPLGYGTAYATAAEIEAKLIAEHYHPEFVRRFMAWMIAQGGAVGVGGTRREFGLQPDRPGFAPDGKSFHQPQRCADGWAGPCAIDLVAPDGPDANHTHDGVSWSMVPVQNTPAAARWGLHCNVGAPPGGEPWHIQPIEIDGYDTWLANGRPAPRRNYPLPDREDDDMAKFNGIRLQIRDKTGKLYLDQIVGTTLANPEHVVKIGAADSKLYTATIDATREELEDELQFKLTPS